MALGRSSTSGDAAPQRVVIPASPVSLHGFGARLRNLSNLPRIVWTGNSLHEVVELSDQRLGSACDSGPSFSSRGACREKVHRRYDLFGIA